MFAGPSHVAGGRPGDKKDDIDGILPSTPGLPVPAMPTIFDMFRNITVLVCIFRISLLSCL